MATATRPTVTATDIRPTAMATLRTGMRPTPTHPVTMRMRRDVPMRRGEEGKSVCEATIKVRVGKEIAHKVAEGDGPVNALDSALRLALGKFFPQLKKVQLTDYKVRILQPEIHKIAAYGLKLNKRLKPDRDSTETERVLQSVKSAATGTAAKTRVLIESSDGDGDWGTVGVSDNIIEASLQALVDSMEYALVRKQLPAVG